jgi:uncharacterized protein (DUF58 family)
MNWFRPFDIPKVEPAAQAIRTSTALVAPTTEDAGKLLQRLEWTTLKRLDGLLQGDYRTLFRGVGLDLADLREYQLHDDVRHIDWNVTARMQTPYVRQFSEDRDMNAWFLVDLSPSADFTSGARSKRMLTIEFVGLMARLITQHGNRAGLMRYSIDVDCVITPRADRMHVLHLLHRLMQRPLYDAAKARKVTQLQALLQRASETIKRRSAVFIVSDFISEPGWDVALKRLAQRHDVVVVEVNDPLEATLPDVGLMTLEDPETGEQLFVDTTDPALRARFAGLHQAQAESRIRTFADAGVTVLSLRTDQSLIDNLVRFVGARTRRTQGARASRAAPTTPQNLRRVA